MRRSNTICGLLLLATACVAPPLPAQYNPAAPRVDLPEFTETVTFSPRAKKKMVATKETMRIVGYYYGKPKPNTPAKYLNDKGQVMLGQFNIEFGIVIPMHVSHVLPVADALEYTDDKTPSLFVKTTSGTRLVNHYLLNCDTFDGSMDKIPDGHLTIACKLIGE